MERKKIMIDSEIYTVFEEYRRKGDAVVREQIAAKTGLFKKLRTIKRGGRWLLCIRGVARDVSKITPEALMTQCGEKPGIIHYDRNTGRRVD